ncbi:hypothetical protein BCAH1134_C0761 (plasmid) [Bacillus cereus AH1134]|nr:hypothetical protein BCAH1134_C0761 [Bacillus cereus AH1134]
MLNVNVLLTSICLHVNSIFHVIHWIGRDFYKYYRNTS